MMWLALPLYVLLAVAGLFCAAMLARERWLSWGAPARTLAVAMVCGAAVAALIVAGVAISFATLSDLAIMVVVFTALACLLLRRIVHLRRWVPRVLLAMLLGVFVANSVGKGTITDKLRATYLTIMADGTLKGPTNVVASAAGASAVQAVVDYSSTLLAIASNGVQWAAQEAADLEAVVTNTQIAWLSADMVPAQSSNVVARCDLLATVAGSNNVLDCYVNFNVVPASAPLIPFEACTSNGVWVTFPAVSNSFPNLVAVSTGGSVSSCYVYRVEIPVAFQKLALIPQTAVTFGGGMSNAPLAVLGGVMVDNQIGRTTAITNSGKVLSFVGGALVGVQ